MEEASNEKAGLEGSESLAVHPEKGWAVAQHGIGVGAPENRECTGGGTYRVGSPRFISNVSNISHLTLPKMLF